MDIEDEQFCGAFRKRYASRSTTLEAFVADPAKYLHIAAAQRMPVYISSGGKVVFVIEDGDEHLKWTDRYFEARRIAGALSPEIDAVIGDMNRLRGPARSA